MSIHISSKKQAVCKGLMFSPIKSDYNGAKKKLDKPNSSLGENQQIILLCFMKKMGVI